MKPYEPTSAHLDSRDKLEADVKIYLDLPANCRNWGDFSAVIGWLDRQAAITERECRRPNWEYCETCETIVKLKAELEQYEAVDEAKEMWAKACELERAKNAELIAERDEWQRTVDDYKERKDALVAERDRLLRQVELKDDTIEGLRKSLDETIAERNELVRCLEADHGPKASWDGVRKFCNIERTSDCAGCAESIGAYADSLCDPLKEQIADLKAKLDDFDGDCYCGETVVGWYEHAVLMESKVDEMEQTHMRLPVDADGVPCRIGDVLDWDGGRSEVMAVSEGCVWFDTDKHELCLTCFESSGCRHVQPDTVESLLEDFHGKLWSDDEEQMAMLEEYAERIRKAVENG